MASLGGWSTHLTAEGREFYYNDASTWEKRTCCPTLVAIAEYRPRRCGRSPLPRAGCATHRRDMQSRPRDPRQCEKAGQEGAAW